MAVPVLSSNAEPAPGALRSKVAAKKSRVVRRRGRAHDSDDEIEREARSDDSDSASDGSSVDSDSDSETEPVSDAAPNGHGHSRVLTPGTSRSPDSVSAPQPLSGVDKEVSAVNGHATHGPFLDAQNWSDMVADEDAHGTADLPVIDFSDLAAQPVGDVTPARPVDKPLKNGRPPPPRSTAAPVHPPAASGTPPPRQSQSVVDEAEGQEDEPIASGSRAPDDGPSSSRRPFGQTARQAYQQRLEKDPSFVPTVGEFWGHDDRLLDKDLRSLSGWWRGRWQGRGRGTGFGGRGRGGFYGARERTFSGHGEASLDENEGQSREQDVPPIERPWTHDGFEEMKQRDEHRRLQQDREHGAPRGGFGAGFRGARGGFGRGGFFARGGGNGFVSSPYHARQGLVGTTTPDRVWFAMKPDRMWTKQHEGFLYLDAAMKPRPGLGQGFKVRLPGGEGIVVRAAAQPFFGMRQSTSYDARPKQEHVDVAIVVRLPSKAADKARATQGPSPAAPAVSGAAPARVAPVATPARAPAAIPNAMPTPPSEAGSLPSDKPQVQAAPEVLKAETPVFVPQASFAASVLPTQAVTPPAETVAPSTSELPPAANSAQPPQLEPLTIPVYNSPAPAPPLAAPPAAPSPPTYGSPYGYPPPLPPGVAMGHNGVPYEVSTGRPVYLQTPPPPPPAMFTPRPMMPGPFVPGHMHHPSALAAPDFRPQHQHHHSHSQSLSGFVDPSTGAPIFTPARQSSRVEIRAPIAGAAAALTSLGGLARPSPLRSALVGQADGAAPSVGPGPGGDGAAGGQPQQPPTDGALSHPMDAAMMGYNPYQPQAYYYPEQYGYYGEYAPYPQYDMYQHPHPPPPSASQEVPHGTVFYT